ncbi:hypothetical protein NM688_g4573 [Phlebia brevispora]|uniref:Uncharacterized protein n=1 Tax=Phlebia brevispora TaxID=194682 RepID=A0ACC1T2V9_9APHY|nr:hypothetical protein NM688_g4573 [Phlebia brevispora]
MSEENNYASSSGQIEDGSPGLIAGEKKRRVRACDNCRRRKVRCDGGRASGDKCSNCAAFDYTCTYDRVAVKRYTNPEYVQNLETQLARTQDMLLKLSARLETLNVQGISDDGGLGISSGVRSPPNEGDTSTRFAPPPPTALLPGIVSRSPQDDEELDSSDDETTLRQSLELSIKNLTLRPKRANFFGKSSGLMFLQTALDLRDQYVHGKAPDKGAIHARLANAREEFWDDLSRDSQWITPPEYAYPIQAFPEPPLMQSLVELYFSNLNIFLPLLHRPTFEKELRDGLHLVDEGFGAVVLLVCALGAKFSDDPRVLLDGVKSVHSSGWKWFQCVQSVRKAFRLVPPSLRDLQISCLGAEFLHTSPVAQLSFSCTGQGIRMAQDLGIHRRKVYAKLPPVEGEMMKRAFWILVTLDRAFSSILGRACCIQDEDFDVDYVIECDDEYWFNDKGEPVFQQPPGKPSYIAFFNSLIRLNQILGCVLRTVYAINKSKSLLGFTGPDWEQHIVTELDSALNQWVDTVPNHLKWDPRMENTTYLDQSAFLHTAYYVLQITIHRPYIPSPRKKSPLGFPSLAICTNAARSCIHVMDTQFNRTARSSYQTMIGCFSSAVVLMLNIWGGKHSALSPNMSREVADIHKAMLMLKALERRWYAAGKILDLLSELAMAGDFPLPRFDAGPKQRQQTSNTESLASQNSPMPQSFSQSNAAQTANIQGVFQQTEVPNVLPTQGVIPGTSPTTFNSSDTSLPMHSDELGRFLLHPAFYSHSNPGQFSDAGAWTSSTTSSSGTSATQNNTDASSGSNAMDLDSIFVSNAVPSSRTYQTPQDFLGQTAWDASGNMLDNNSAEMWNSAPVSMEWEDWCTYIQGINGAGSTAGSSESSQPVF